MLKKTWAFAFIAAMVIIPALAAAQTPDSTSVDFGPFLSHFLIDYLLPAIGTLLGALLAWLAWKIKNKFGIDIDAGHRASIEAFAVNAAGNWLKNFDSLQGIEIDAKNPIIAQLATEALKRIPDAMEHFHLTPEDIANRIVDKIGVLTAATTVTTTAAASGGG